LALFNAVSTFNGGSIRGPWGAFRRADS
jgi:hypothetical protein